MHSFSTVWKTSRMANRLGKPMNQPEISYQPVSLPQADSLHEPAFRRNGLAPIVLPSDPKAAAALVLSFVTTSNTGAERSTAIEAFSNRVALLRESSGAQQEEELFGHCCLLQALWLRYATEAARAEKPENSAIFCKLALLCQASYMRTALAVESLRAQRQQRPGAALGCE